MQKQKKHVLMYLKNALDAPTFKPNIFSVQAATKDGVHISFECDNSQLINPNGAVLNITESGHLYYLKNIVSPRNATYNLHIWHKILGHCNESDIKTLPKLLKGTKTKPTLNSALNWEDV